MTYAGGPEHRVDLGRGAAILIEVLKYWWPGLALFMAALVARGATGTLTQAAALWAVVVALAVPLIPPTRRLARALQGMQAVVAADEARLTLPTWGTWLGASMPLVNVEVPRVDIEAVEVGRDPAGSGLARKADLILKTGRRVPIWRYSEGFGKQWTWRPGEGWRENTAATYASTHPSGVSLHFRLLGALFGFAERLAAALDVPYRNRVVP